MSAALRRLSGWRRWVAVWAIPLLAAGVYLAVSPPAIGASSGSSSPVNAAVEWQDHCASCHGENGRGTSRAPDLAGVGEAMVDFELTTGRMPKGAPYHQEQPYRPVLPPAVIAALDQYVTKLVAHGGPGIPSIDPQAGSVSHGQNLFSTNCAACHGWGGAGGELIDRSIPDIRDATPEQVAEAVRSGPAEMPVFGTQQISNSQLNDVVDYVLYTKHLDNRGGNPMEDWGPIAEGAATWLIGMAVLLGFMRWVGKRG